MVEVKRIAGRSRKCSIFEVKRGMTRRACHGLGLVEAETHYSI